MNLQEPFGICQNYPRQVSFWHLSHDLEIIRRMGVKWLRTDFDWRKIEPRRGLWKFRWHDALVRLCQIKGINLLPVLINSPKWAAPRFNFPPEEASLFSDFVKKVVKRYHHFIKHWEIWNEANSYFFWVGDPKQYASILTVASRSAKEIDPNAKILLCGLADPARPDPSFLFEVLLHVDENCLDIINLHAYPGTWNGRKIEEWPLFLKNLGRRLDEIGIRKPIWITETGLTSQDDNSNRRESMQASYLIKAFTSLLGSGEVEKVFWYRLKDEKSPLNADERFGLLTQKTVAENSKLVNRAYSKLARTLPLSAGSLGNKFFIDSRKLAFRSYADLIRLLGNNIETGLSDFGDDVASVSFSNAVHSVRIYWKEDTKGFPLTSVSGFDSNAMTSEKQSRKIGKFPTTVISNTVNTANKGEE